MEDLDLAWFTEGTDEFGAYVADMLWAQDYARANRDQMKDNALADQSDLVEVRHTLHQVLNYKGT